MGKLTVTTFVTLDGVMQGPGGPDEDTSGSFTRGGWVAPYFDDDAGASIVDVFSRADAFLLGRKTYEIFASYWPKVTDPNNPIATALNELPKFVASKTLKSADWNRSTVLRGDVAGGIRRLKREQERELQVHGSGALVQSLLDNELVDEMNLCVFPVVLGQGRRLFTEGVAATAFTLSHCRTTDKGVAIQVYRVAGKPTYGTVGA